MIAERPKMSEYNGQIVSYLQEKYNGMFVQIERLRSVNVYTRTPGVDLWPQLEKTHLAELCMSIPIRTSVFAELYWGGPATAIKTLLNERSDKLKLCAFAMPWIGGTSLSSWSLLNVMGELRGNGWETPKTTALTPNTAIKDVEKYKRLAVTRKIEGYVAKKSHMSGWYKIKPVKTIDCVVMSTNKSWAATTFGELKSLNVGVFKDGRLTEIASVGTGFSASERASLKLSSLPWLICEVSYQDIAQQGRLQFPRFVRWREDKEPEQCTL